MWTKAGEGARLTPRVNSDYVQRSVMIVFINAGQVCVNPCRHINVTNELLCHLGYTVNATCCLGLTVPAVITSRNWEFLVQSSSLGVTNCGDVSTQAVNKAANSSMMADECNKTNRHLSLKLNVGKKKVQRQMQVDIYEHGCSNQLSKPGLLQPFD